MKVRLIHGIHAKEGKHNMARLLPFMQKAMPGAKVELWEYGFLGFWQARWRNERLASQLDLDCRQNREREPEIWITHSNGAAIAYLATKNHGTPVDMIININPALDRHLSAEVRRVETIHSEQDRWVDLSQWLPFHIWGDQGRVGYTGKQTNTLNHDASKVGGVMEYRGHCDLFSSLRIQHWAYFFANRIDETGLDCT